MVALLTALEWTVSLNVIALMEELILIILVPVMAIILVPVMAIILALAMGHILALQKDASGTILLMGSVNSYLGRRI